MYHKIIYTMFGIICCLLIATIASAQVHLEQTSGDDLSDAEEVIFVLTEYFTDIEELPGDYDDAVTSLATHVQNIAKTCCERGKISGGAGGQWNDATGKCEKKGGGKLGKPGQIGLGRCLAKEFS